MIFDTVSSLGPWTWLIVGLLLLVGEAVVPGVFLMWFGIAGVVIGGLSLLPFADVAWWPWQVQLVAFGVLSLVLVFVGNRLFPSNSKDDEASKMNDPLAKFVGRDALVSEAIENGVGRVKLGDTVWRVRGADAAAGAKVRVVAVEEQTLIVEPIA
ncbi:NfeD family protein [Pseudahrensia aquimaris]|uniref:NfeD family protein n=1 Tax=Pseudahrensia aquimaris TaxID=744461 RepID=A0ABW3FG52_9HYPH